MADFILQQFKSSFDKLLTIRHFSLEDLDELLHFFKKGIEETTHTLLCKEKPITESKMRCNNERGMILYLKNGFKIEGIRESGAFIEGEFVNEYFIAKLLKGAEK